MARAGRAPTLGGERHRWMHTARNYRRHTARRDGIRSWTGARHAESTHDPRCREIISDGPTNALRSVWAPLTGDLRPSPSA